MGEIRDHIIAIQDLQARDNANQLMKVSNGGKQFDLEEETKKLAKIFF